MRKPRREPIPEHLPVVEEVLFRNRSRPVRKPGGASVRNTATASTDLRAPARPPDRCPCRQPRCPPVTAKLPPRLQDGLTAAPGLIAHAIVSKYCDHLPFYRQEKILASRHGVDIGRNTLCRCAELAAFWLRPLHQRIHAGLLAGDYLQADETPVKYLAPGTGRTGQGYRWTLHRPGGDVFYQWHASRKQACLAHLLGGFRGIVQCDGYAAYDSHAAKHPGIVLAACWAHARRKFHEAFQTGQPLAAGPLQAIARLNAIEKELRQSRAGPAERAAIRQSQGAPILETLRHDLIQLRGHPSVLPKSSLGRAIDYAMALWPKLAVFLRRGEVEIDNNPIENAIRPTAAGKKNWLFVGGEDTGGPSATLHPLIESAKRDSHEPYAYLKDVLDRLLGMNPRELDALLPANRSPATKAAFPLQTAG